MKTYEPEIDAIVPSLGAVPKTARVVRVVSTVNPRINGVWERKSSRHFWAKLPPGQVPMRNQPLSAGVLKRF